MSNQSHKKRIYHIDFIRAFGMFLVFYGHFIEKIYYSGVEAAFIQFKLIYSMHMPLFFFLAGVFFKPDHGPLSEFYYKKVKTRLVPVLFFAIILIPLWLVNADNWSNPFRNLLFYFSGRPTLNWVTWFLVCLFTLEMILKLFFSYFSSDNKIRILVYIICFALTGWFISSHTKQISFITGISGGFWFIHAACVAISLYLSGYLLRDFVLRPRIIRNDLLLGLFSLSVLLLTFDLNTGPFNNEHKVVMMTFTSLGNFPLFYISALSGILASVSLVRLISFNFKITNFIGQNTLIYLGLNGISLHFLDKYVLEKLTYRPDQTPEILLFCSLYCILIMALFAPFAYWLKKYLPQLAGSPHSKTSLIPPLSTRPLSNSKVWKILTGR